LRPRSRRNRGVGCRRRRRDAGFAALDDEGLAAYGAEGAHGAVDAADEEFCGAVEDFAGAASLAVQGWSCGVHSEIEKG